MIVSCPSQEPQARTAHSYSPPPTLNTPIVMTIILHYTNYTRGVVFFRIPFMHDVVFVFFLFWFLHLVSDMHLLHLFGRALLRHQPQSLGFS